MTTTPANDLATTAAPSAPDAGVTGWPAVLVAVLLDGAGPGDRLPSGARITAVGAEADAVRLALERDGASVAAWLRLRAAGGAAYRTTEHFLVGHEGHTLEAAARRLLDELHGDIARREGALPAALLDAMRVAAVGARRELPMPIEWLAVRSGAKPAARQVPSGAGVGDELLAAAERHGLCALAVDAADYLADFSTGDGAGCRTIVYVGATPEAARAARDAEQAMIAACARGEAVTPAQNAALGRALGYPECCVAAFVPHCDVPNATLRFEALRRTGAKAFAVLNDLDPRRALVSHFVCRYDCPASLRHAHAVLDAVAAVDAPRAAELARALAGLVVLFRDEGALQLDDARPAGDGRWVYRSLRGYGTLGAHASWRDALAHADAVHLAPGVVAPFRAGAPLPPLRFDEARVEIRPFGEAP